MVGYSKKYTDYTEFQKASIAMDDFQVLHVRLRDDYETLLNITENYKSKKIEFDSLYRASLRSLFSLIEADIYVLNRLDKYENYSDRDTFEKKFKKTFKQISTTWKRPEISRKYFDNKYKALRELKKKRDELVHPKKIEHIPDVREMEFDILKEVFLDYDRFIINLMKDFYINIEFR